jgi:non-heme chloroperoxidase
LHGGGQTRHSWKKLAQTLIRSGYRVTNVDLRGHGESDWSADGDYRLDTLVSDLHVLIGHQKSPPIVIGASLGGITALLAIGECDRHIASGMVLVDIVPRIEAEGSAAILKFMAGNPDGFASLEEAAAAVAAYLPHRPRPPSNEGLMKNLRSRNGRLYWHWDPKLLAVQNLEQRHDDVKPRLEHAARQIRIPTLLVRGSKSDLVSIEGARHFLELIPHAGFVDVQGAAHMVAGDMNDVFSQSIVDFVRDKLPA